uniref:Uncharacterized protein n=1 Tax=Tanacetum cinerariifolium TaxID=118510 RepID=A0A699GMT4_TANCI|nr:hypothetical protein [Tanacetum cinerariifolium]
MGFDLVGCYLYPSFIKGGTVKGVGLRVVNLHTSNHRKDNSTLLETIRRFLGIIGSRSLSSSEGRPSSQIKGNFMFAEDDEEMTFLPREPSPGFEGGSPSTSINNQFRKTDFAGKVHSSKFSPTKVESSTFLTISDDEGLPDAPELQTAVYCYLIISNVTPPPWRGHLDNRLDFELLDLHDHCYTSQAMVDNAANQRSRELLKENLANLESKVGVLQAEKGRLEAVEALLCQEVKAVKHDRTKVVSKVVPYVSIELVHSDDIVMLVGKLVSFAIFYGRCVAFEDVTNMNEPFDLVKVKVKALLSKKPKSLLRLILTKTHAPAPSAPSQKATTSTALSSKPMSPPSTILRSSCWCTLFAAFGFLACVSLSSTKGVSTRKSASIFPLVEFCPLNLMSCSPSLMAHLAIRPDFSGLARI